LDEARGSNGKENLNYQSLLMSDISSALPPQPKDFFEIQFGKNSTHIIISEGSVEQSHAEGSSLFELKADQHCSLSSINTANCSLYHVINKEYEKYFDFEQVALLTAVYKHFMQQQIRSLF